MTIESEMKKPKQFPGPYGVVNATLIPLVMFYAIVGFFGYKQFGLRIDGSLSLSLPVDLL